MRKLAYISLLSLPLMANFFPQTVQTSIASVEGKSASLSQPFPANGMSGVVVHNYGNNIQAVTSRVIRTNNGTVKILADDIMKHEQLPTIKTKVVTGDKVIGGYLYNNVLLLAPDAQTYAEITANTNKNWIHPDLYALFLEDIGDTVPSKENLQRFAKAYQVGLIYIVSQGKAKLLDPISGKIVSQKPIAGLPSKGKSPFYMRFSQIDAGLFSSNNTQSYYKIMEQF